MTHYCLCGELASVIYKSKFIKSDNIFDYGEKIMIIKCARPNYTSVFCNLKKKNCNYNEEILINKFKVEKKQLINFSNSKKKIKKFIIIFIKKIYLN